MIVATTSSSSHHRTSRYKNQARPHSLYDHPQDKNTNCIDRIYLLIKNYFIMATRALLVRNLRTFNRPTYLAARTFVSSVPQRKTVTETVKDAAKAVDKSASTAAIKGLEGLESVNEAAKGVAEKVGIKTEQAADDLEVKGRAAATKAEVKTEHVKRDAKAGVREAADKVKDATR